MRKPLFTGCGTALITPFKNGEVDFEALDKLVEDQITKGVSALIAVGTTGEPATMTWEEHLAVIRRVVEKADHRVPVIAGTGSNATSEAVYAAKHSAEFGADAQLVVTPYYNKTSQAGLVAHFNAIADAATLPVIVYNVPSRTGLNIGPEALAEICQHENVIAVKEANSDVAQAMEKVRLCGDKVDFYCGNDDLIVPTIACGFKGGEVVPSFFVGATFGCVVGALLGLPAGMGAAIGMIGVFCGAVNCPLASMLLSIELFGADGMLYFALTCAISCPSSSAPGIS